MAELTTTLHTPSDLSNPSLNTAQQIRIAVLEFELKHERATNKSLLSSSQQIIQSLTSVITSIGNCNSLRSVSDHDSSREARHLRKLLQKSKEENARLQARFRSATHLKAGDLAKKHFKFNAFLGAAKDSCEGALTGHSDPVNREQSFDSLIGDEFSFDYKALLDVTNSPDMVEYQSASSFHSNITGSTTGPRTSCFLAVDQKINTDFRDTDFLTLDDVLGKDEGKVQDHTGEAQNGIDTENHSNMLMAGAQEDGTELSFNKGQRSVDVPSRVTPAVSPTPAPAVLKVGLDAKRASTGGEYSIENSSSPNRRRTGHVTSRDSNFDANIWDSAEEREAAIHATKELQGNGRVFPDFFRHGLRYSPSQTDTNVFRTVHIGNLPLNISLRNLLARVRGGEIVSATLCDSVKITGFMSALIVFLNDGPAAEYAQYANEHPIRFGSQQAIVTLINTPTWPLSIQAKRRIYEHGQTRSLIIYDFPRTVSRSSLTRHFACGNGHRADAIEALWIDDEENLQINFSSIQAAGSAYGILTNFREYQFLRVAFMPDPCARPLSDLLAPAGPRINPDEVVLSYDEESEDNRIDQPSPLEGDAMFSKAVAALESKKSSLTTPAGPKINLKEAILFYDKESEDNNVEPPAALKSNSLLSKMTGTSDFKKSSAFTSATATANVSHESWADEVIEAAAAAAEEFKSPPKPDRILVPKATTRESLRGLASSKYSSLVPRFADGVQPRAGLRTFFSAVDAQAATKDTQRFSRVLKDYSDAAADTLVASTNSTSADASKSSNRERGDENNSEPVALLTPSVPLASSSPPLQHAQLDGHDNTSPIDVFASCDIEEEADSDQHEPNHTALDPSTAMAPPAR